MTFASTHELHAPLPLSLAHALLPKSHHNYVETPQCGPKQQYGHMGMHWNCVHNRQLVQCRLDHGVGSTKATHVTTVDSDSDSPVPET